MAPRSATTQAEGAALFATVQAYANLGDHRTGSAVDYATQRWAVAMLGAAGARVQTQHFRFPRFDAEWQVEIDGRAVESLPLFYCGPPSVTAQNVPLVRVELKAGHEADALLRVERAAADHLGALIVVTESATGGLYALNCVPRPEAKGAAVLLVGAADVAGRDVGRNRVVFRHSVLEGRSANIIADFGNAGAVPRLIVSTPVTGWFACAGERGSGVAIAFDIAERLGRDVPVRLVLSGGHELDHIGLDAYFAAYPPTAGGDTVLHVGACVAAGTKNGNGCFELTRNIRLTAHADEMARAKMADAMARRGIAFVAAEAPSSPASWRGEARNWAPRATRLASLVGFAPHFHEPDDLPERVCDPALLALVRDGVEAVARALVK